MVCWKCSQSFKESEVEIIEARRRPDIVQITWRCPDDGVINRWRVFNKLPNRRYLAVFVENQLVTDDCLVEVCNKLVEKNFDILLLPGGKPDFYLIKWALKSGKDVVVFLPFDIKRHPWAGVRPALRRLPPENVVEHPEWVNRKNPIYLSSPEVDYDPAAPFKARNREILSLADEILVFKVKGGDPWHKEIVGSREVEVIEVDFEPTKLDIFHFEEISF